MPKTTFTDKVLASFNQGVVAAVIGAGLGAVTEPVVNKVLVERISVTQALQSFNWDKAFKMFYGATLPTNLIKFPFYEVINFMLTQVALPDTGRGAVTGAVFTTMTLPLGNYRFCKSMNIPIDMAGLYKAYWPTLLRDVIYGVVRSNVTQMIAAARPDLNKSALGRFVAMFICALVACIVSSPGNELRGYALQPPNKRQGFGEFFQPSKYVRSTGVGATNLGLSLAIGTLVVGPTKVIASQSKAFLAKNPAVAVGLAMWSVHQYLANKRTARLEKALARGQDDADEK